MARPAAGEAQRCPAHQRQTVELTYFGALNTAEIARMLYLPVAPHHTRPRLWPTPAWNSQRAASGSRSLADGVLAAAGTAAAVCCASRALADGSGHHRQDAIAAVSAEQPRRSCRAGKGSRVGSRAGPASRTSAPSPKATKAQSR